MIAGLTERWAASADDEEKHRLLSDLISYVDAIREGIENCARHGSEGSGAIETMMDAAAGRRLEAKGTSWYRPGTHRPLSLWTLKQDRTRNRHRQGRRSRTSPISALAG